MAKKTLVNWEAREYIEYKKNAGWYIGLIIITVGLCGIAVWLQQWTFFLLIIVAVAALLVYTMRSPRLLHYSLTDKGLSEGNNLYLFSLSFKFGAFMASILSI